MPIDPGTALLIAQLGGSLLNGIFGGSDSGERKSFEGKGSISPEAMMRSNQALLGNFGKALTDRMNTPVSLPSAYAQQPGVYTGGGMPFPIGLVATDPALKNPSLLNRPGMGEFANVMSGLNLGDPGGQPTYPSLSNPPGSTTTPFDSFIPGNNIDPDGPLGPDAPLGDAFDNFFQTPFDQRTPENRQGTTDGTEPQRGNQAEARAPEGPRRRIYREGDAGDYGQLVRAEDLGLSTDQNPGDDLKKAMGAVDLLMHAYGGR